jgi:hypothetical protein
MEDSLRAEDQRPSTASHCRWRVGHGLLEHVEETVAGALFREAVTQCSSFDVQLHFGVFGVV